MLEGTTVEVPALIPVSKIKPKKNFQNTSLIRMYGSIKEKDVLNVVGV